MLVYKHTETIKYVYVLRNRSLPFKKNTNFTGEQLENSEH